ncbi:hypothetical protein BVX93_01950 [bacterium B13(2017)]|nr:hypothetical protein BVX93_01950 [bacterium B13(2017)]
MSGFITDVQNYTFLQYALFTGILASIACGIVGTYVTVRRITSIAGAIAHSTLGGMGLAFYLNRECGLNFLSPIHGALFAALLAAIVIGLVSIYSKQREDTILSAVWAIGMAIGLFFISFTKGYNEDLMSYLFGNILMVSKNDLWIMIFLDIFIITICFCFYHKFLALCFDEEFAYIRGINTKIYYLLLLILTALTIVVLTQIVGIVMVIALLALPVATISPFAKRLSHMMIFGSFLCMIYTSLGLFISYEPEFPPGATIILLAGSVYFLVLISRSLCKKMYKK